MKIAGVLELSSRTRYGMTSRNTPIYLFRPLDVALSPCVVGSSHRDVSRNVLALAEVAAWEPRKLTRATLVEIIGPCGDIHAERRALLLQYSRLPWRKFDSKSVRAPSAEGRLKVSGYTLNIDPVGCRDIDDAITFGDDGFTYITIADVAAWVAANPAHAFVDVAAELGQTLYENGRAVSPMLPIEQECSLLPGTERLGVSLRFRWTGAEMTDVEFVRTAITNTASFTYESIYASPHAQTIRAMAGHLAGHDSFDSHEWVEHLMLFYNCEAAKVLVEKNRGFLRVHESPDAARMEEIRAALGYDARFLAYKSAQYVDVREAGDRTHWGLAKKHYCHASSPIRRFADVVNQSVLTDQDCDWTITSAQLNESARRARQFERDAFFLEQVMATDSRSTSGVVLNDRRVWAPEWQRMVSCKNDAAPGTRGILRFSLDMNQPTWKRRMVFRFGDTGCPG
jgi:exoribonuclease R